MPFSIFFSAFQEDPAMPHVHVQGHVGAMVTMVYGLSVDDMERLESMNSQLSPKKSHYRYSMGLTKRELIPLIPIYRICFFYLNFYFFLFSLLLPPLTPLHGTGTMGITSFTIIRLKTSSTIWKPAWVTRSWVS